MHFFDFWFTVSPLALLRLAVPAALLLLLTLLPGRGVAAAASFGMAIAVLFLRELATPWPLRAAWSAIWLAVAWQAGRAGPAPSPARRPRAGGLESGTVGLLIGLAFMLLLVASLARQDLPPEVGRRVVYALFILGLGVLHLMLRGHVRRAAIAFAALGLGLQMLESAGRAAQITSAASPSASVWLACAITVALVFRIGWAREHFAGTPSVRDAHDLHD